jgi:hypothetical protein
MMIIDPVALADVASTRPSPKNVYDKAGTLVTVPAGQLAISYDPSDLTKAPYPLIEGAATNLLKASDRMTAPGWATAAAIAIAFAAPSPDGANAATLLVETTANGVHVLSNQTATQVAGTQYTYSVYAKRAFGTRGLTIDQYTGTVDVLSKFDLSASGTVLSGTGSITYVGGGWYRCSQTVTATTTGANVYAAQALISSGITHSYAGDGVSGIYLWGAQLEVGDHATSYIPTPPTFVSRASTATYYDAIGTLQTAAANVARMTYDPANLSAPPYLMVENAATNLYQYSEQLDNGAWSASSTTVTANATAAPDGNLTADAVVEVASTAAHEMRTPSITLTSGTTYTQSVFAKAGARKHLRVGFSSVFGVSNAYAVFDVFSGTVISASGGVSASVSPVKNGFYRCSASVTVTTTATGTNYMGLQPDAVTTTYAGDGTSGFYLWGAQIETGNTATSYIATAAAAVTRAPDVVSYSQSRAADTIGAGAGLVYSNVALTETAYSAAATYAQNAQVYDSTTYLMYQSLINANTGKALTDTTAWTPLKKSVNRWQLFDSYNNTQTSNPEEIIVVLSPQAISQGIYLGNVDATEVRISVVDLTDGLVYRETQSLVVADSKSSFYNWCFKRIRRRSYAVSVALPPYANALVTIAIRKPGSTAKCGVCALGPLIDVGLSKYGLSREIRDFSTLNFNFDGTSNEVIRNFAKRMDVDVAIDNDQIDSVIENLEAYRQKPVAWIGAKEFGSACVFGRYSSFKNVIQNKPLSQMNLQIEGTV